jgi:hypothetical protein
MPSICNRSERLFAGALVILYLLLRDFPGGDAQRVFTALKAVWMSKFRFRAKAPLDGTGGWVREMRDCGAAGSEPKQFACRRLRVWWEHYRDGCNNSSGARTHAAMQPNQLHECLEKFLSSFSCTIGEPTSKRWAKFRGIHSRTIGRRVEFSAQAGTGKPADKARRLRSNRPSDKWCRMK